MSTPFKPLEIPPGVVANATKQMRSSSWAEVNLMRWREGQMMPIGGQAQYSNIVGGVEKYVFASRSKKIHGWYDLNQVYHIAYLCEGHLYIDTGGTLIDISPTPPLVSPASLGTGGYGDGVYGMGGEIAATTAFTTDSPNIAMQPNPGWVIPGTHVFNKTLGPIGPDNDLLLVGVVETYVGGALTLVDNAAVASAGAADVLMFGGYGEARPISLIQALDKVPDAFSLDNFGSILYAMTSPDGRLLMWDPAVGGAAVVQPADAGRGPVPNGRCFVVTPERFLVIFGSLNDGTAGGTSGGGFRRFAWCDQENPAAWDYSNVTSQAGFLDVEPASPIICALSTRSGTLFWTGKKTYVSQFLGSPYIYNYVELAANCTPWSPQSMVNTSSMAVWVSEQGVFSFDGTSVLPMACKVRVWIDDDIDILNVREQACLVHVSTYNEVWWFFPQDGQSYNTRVAIYNYKEGWWSEGQMARSAGVAGAYNVHTIMANGTIAYEHEIGSVYPSDVPLPWAETYDLNLASGGRLTTVKQMIPDIEGDATNLLYSLFYKNSRSLSGGKIVVEQQTAPRPVRSDGYVDFRTTGRDIRMRIQIAGPAVDFVTVGQHLIDSVVRGDR